MDETTDERRSGYLCSSVVSFCTAKGLETRLGNLPAGPRECSRPPAQIAALPVPRQHYSGRLLRLPVLTVARDPDNPFQQSKSSSAHADDPAPCAEPCAFLSGIARRGDRFRECNTQWASSSLPGGARILRAGVRHPGTLEACAPRGGTSPFLRSDSFGCGSAAP